MPVTRSNAVDEIMNDWFAAHPKSIHNAFMMQADPAFQRLLPHLWPMTLEYSFPIPPVPLVVLNTPKLIASKPSWLVRDGLVPLLWFFRSNPKPPFPGHSKAPRLWVNERLADFIPPAWRPFVGSYRLRSSSPRKAKAKGLLLTGVMMPMYCSLDSLDRQLEQIVDHYGKRSLASMELLAFLPANFLEWNQRPQHEYHSEYLLRVCRRLGTRIRTLKWAELDAAPSLAGFDVVDLNEGLLWQDSFPMHLAAGRGAQPLFLLDHARQENSHATFRSISPDHGFELRYPLRGSSGVRSKTMALERYLERFETAMRSEANLGLPWPSWFPQLARGANQD